MKIRRRDFIKILSSSTGFGVAYGYGLFSSLPGGRGTEALAKQLENISIRPPEEKWIPTVCQQCPGGCGILVRIYGDRAVKIDGNPLHPINRGRLCPRGQSGLQYLYDPDRIKGPMARVGERGEDKWKPITWEEALSTLGGKLKELRKKGSPQALVMLTGAQRGITRSVSERFMETYGSPNLIRFQSDRSEGMTQALHLMQGGSAGITYDIKDTAYILSFNSGLLDDHWSQVQLSRAFGEFRRGRKQLRGKLIHIEPRLSVTGGKADQWIPVHPGSEGVLAMGIASVLIIERRYDEGFIQERTFGFEDWTDKNGTLHPGFKTLLIQEYPLEKVVKTTGVSRDTIISIARDFSRIRPALAIGSDAQGIGSQSVYNRMAIHALNALVGSIQKQGGVLTNAKLPKMPLPSYTPDPVAVRGNSTARIDGAGSSHYKLVQDVPDVLFRRILKKTPSPVEIMLLNGANPLFYSTEPARTLSALKKVPTLISFSSFMDETSRYADLILPDSIYLEKWNLDTSHTLKGNPVVNVGQPAVAPTYDTRDTIEVLAGLTRTLGSKVSNAFPSTKPEDLIKASLKGLHSSAQGEPFGAPLEELWTKLLEQSGWKVRSRGKFEKFWTDLKEKGGWWDPVYYPYEWKRVFSTPSGRFEFYSLTAKEYFNGLKGMDRDLALQKAPLPVNMERADAACLPHGDPGAAKGNEALFDLEVNPYIVPILSSLSHTNQPWLQDITGFHVYQNWHTWAEINPETAHKINVHSGDWAWLETPEGKIKVKVRVYKGTMPHVINLPVGLGHLSGGRWTAGIGENVLQVLPTEKEPYTGKKRFLRSRARLIKA